MDFHYEEHEEHDEHDEHDEHEGEGGGIKRSFMFSAVSD